MGTAQMTGWMWQTWLLEFFWGSCLVTWSGALALVKVAGEVIVVDDVVSTVALAKKMCLIIIVTWKPPLKTCPELKLFRFSFLMSCSLVEQQQYWKTDLCYCCGFRSGQPSWFNFFALSLPHRHFLQFLQLSLMLLWQHLLRPVQSQGQFQSRFR